MSTAEDLAYASGTPRHEHRKATRQMRWWYESLADVMVANPCMTQNELAAHFGRAVSTISTIVNTDAFKAYLRKRRDDHAQTLDAAVRAKLLNVADKGLELILDKLEKKRDTLPIETVQNTIDSTLKALGYGVHSGPSVVVNNTTDARTTVMPVAVSLDDLEVARTALRRNQASMLAPATVIDHEPTNDSSD